MENMKNQEVKTNKALAFVKNNWDKAGVAVGMGMLSVSSYAGIDVTAVVSEIEGLDDPINKIGAAVIGIVVVLFGWAKVKSAVR